MIVALAQETAVTVRQWQTFSQDQQTAEDIKASLDKLRELDRRLELLERSYRLIDGYLTAEMIQDVKEPLRTLLTSLDELQAQFSRRRDLVSAIKAYLQNVSGIEKQLERFWYLYASEQIDRQSELYDLIKNLPEIKQKRSIIEQALNDLREQQQHLPGSAPDLERFNQRLAKVSQSMESLQSLPPSIQEFLRKVGRNECTIADLTEEVLSWCRQENRARTFRVTFA